MNECRWKTLGPEGLRFFGKVCANLSHELKNSLATINEQNGLLEDFLALVERGRPLDPERIHRITAAVSGHVRKGNSIVNKLNRFAHSIDESRKQVELDQLLSHACGLYERPAAIKEVTLVAAPQQQGINIKTNPFLLQQLLLACFEHATNNAEPGTAMQVTVERADDTALITVPGPAPETGPVLNELLEELSGTISADAAENLFRIRLPLKVDAEHVSA